MDTESDRPENEHLVPSLEYVLGLDVEVESPVEIGDIGDGNRRIIPIVGGTVSGCLEGTILSAGADYQLYRTEGPTELVAKYAFETTEGDRVFVNNRGIRIATPKVSKRLRDGQNVDPDEVYFCSVPEFETTTDELAWLTENIFVATGIRQPKGVRLAVYRVN